MMICFLPWVHTEVWNLFHREINQASFGNLTLFSQNTLFVFIFDFCKRSGCARLVFWDFVFKLKLSKILLMFRTVLKLIVGCCSSSRDEGILRVMCARFEPFFQKLAWWPCKLCFKDCGRYRLGKVAKMRPNVEERLLIAPVLSELTSQSQFTPDCN